MIAKELSGFKGWRKWLSLKSEAAGIAMKGPQRRRSEDPEWIARRPFMFG